MFAKKKRLPRPLNMTNSEVTAFPDVWNDEIAGYEGKVSEIWTIADWERYFDLRRLEAPQGGGMSAIAYHLGQRAFGRNRSLIDNPLRNTSHEDAADYFDIGWLDAFAASVRDNARPPESPRMSWISRWLKGRPEAR